MGFTAIFEIDKEPKVVGPVTIKFVVVAIVNDAFVARKFVAK